MLYDIVSHYAVLAPVIAEYTKLSAMYAVVRSAYAVKVYVDKAFQNKTNELVQTHIGVSALKEITDFVAIDANTVELIKKRKGNDGPKVINLIKSIENTAQEHSDDPFLIALADRTKAVQEGFEET